MFIEPPSIRLPPSCPLSFEFSLYVSANMQCLIMGFSDNRVWLQVAKKTYSFPFIIGSSGASFLSVGCSPVLWWFALVWNVLLFVLFLAFDLF